ncbi:unnamed protein product [Tuber aestivum]|uniref:Uncharacterized protein n=1 Tax=Tuber aestivum TaxID=59557 RepID=A0A292PTU9_9PEZI|nr:unnamed protein product [Tuber aestivum]
MQDLFPSRSFWVMWSLILKKVFLSFRTLSHAREARRERWRAQIRRLGPYGLPKFFYPALLPLNQTLTILETNVLCASEHDAMKYRKRRMAECNTTGLTAALVAQVTITTMQLEYIPTIHWTVPALLTSTLVFALLSVYYSFLLYQYLDGFLSAEDMKKAFSHRGILPFLIVDEGETLPSLTAAIKLWAPTYLLGLAISCYIATIGVYWGVAWGMNLQERGVGSRNVFIVFLITASLSICLFAVPNTLGKIEEDIVDYREKRELNSQFTNHDHDIASSLALVPVTGGEGGNGSTETSNTSSTVRGPRTAMAVDVETRSDVNTYEGGDTSSR